MKLPAWCLLLIVLLVSACGRDIEPGRTETEAPAATGLTLSEVRESPVGAFRVVAGTITSSDRSVLAARTDGRIVRIRVKEGESVKAGQALLDIADNTGAARLRQTDSAVAEARQAVAGADAVLTLAQQTERRYRQLFTNQAVTPQEMDRVNAELARAQSGRRQAAAGLKQALAARDAARTMAAFNTLKAPFDARVAKRLTDEGVTVLPGTPLLELDRLGVWQVRAEVPESFAGRLAPGDTVEIEVPALQRSFSARLTEVQPAADPASRSFGIKAEPTQKLPLAAGLFARVHLPLDGETALLIPAAAIAERGQLSGVFVAVENRLHWRLVRTGRRFGEQIEILAGLHPGDRIVTGGIENARDGARLEKQP